MVQNKQKSNKINITALITCFMLIMVFVFGCVQYAFADETKNALYFLQKANASYDAYLCVVTNYEGAEYYQILTYNSFDCGAYVRENNGQLSFGLLSKSRGLAYNISVSMNDEQLYSSSYDYNNCSVQQYYGYEVATHNKFIRFESNTCVFSNYGDLYNYLDTGEVNNPIYQPKENIEYDSDIEVPLNLDIRLNGNSDFVPNVKISCNQTEQVENRYLEIQYSIGYKATWSLLGGIGLNVKSKTSPTLYGSIEQLEDSFDNGGTSFETILSLTKLSHSVAPDKEAFSKYEPTPKTYWSLKEIKNDNSEMKIWCRNRVGNKASKWVMVSGNGYKANFDVVDSDENGNPTDLKDDVANSNTGYGSDYWNNRDTTPQEDYSSANVKTNLKDLKSNYTSLANFYKELFSFLPVEIWTLLIGLVGAMVILALIIFIRG